jgi:glyoxylase-like metal-dependent hydrolase (beta-lactamase superfamily II)
MRSDLLGAAKEKEQEIKTSFETIKFFPPTHLFPIEKGLKLAFGNEKVSVYYPGPAHSKDNVVVYIPSQKVLFGGCMILAQDRIGNKSDADLDLWPKSIENLQKKHFEIEWIIPGHGTNFTPQLFENTLHVLQRSL